MKPLVLVLGAAGVTLLAFSWWGLNTGGGRKSFDEMAGMIPLGASVLGFGLIAVGLFIQLFAWRRAR